MFIARLTSVFIALFAMIGAVSADDKCKTVCCKTAGDVSCDVVDSSVVGLMCAHSGPQWLAGIIVYVCHV